MTYNIPPEIIQEIKGRADILEVISDHVSLRKAGKSYKGLCPFHAEKTPSFTVNPEKGIYYCFGCGTGGDVFQFVMKRDNLSFGEAVSALAERCGLSSLLFSQAGRESREQSQSQRLMAMLEASIGFFQRSLMDSPDGEKARKYLHERGILHETARRFRLGYAPLSVAPLLRHLTFLGYSEETMKEAGLLKEGDRGRYCWLRDRLVFPIFDHRGRAIGFGGRLLENDGKGKYPKYINSPEGPLYSKGEHLYGLNLAKEAIRREGAALVVEGYFDLILLVQSGIENAVASLGTAVTSGHLQLLRRWATQVTVVFDGDAAGMAAVERIAVPFLESGLRARVLGLPAGDDPDSLVRREGKEAFLVRLEKAVPYLEHLINSALSRRDCTRLEGRLECIQDILPLLAKVPNQVEQMSYLSLLAQRTQSSEPALLTELKKISFTRSQVSSQRRIPPSQWTAPQTVFKPDKAYFAERELVQLMLQDGRFIERLRGLIPVESFLDADLREIARSIYEHSWDGLEAETFRAIENLSGEGQKALASQLWRERKEYEDREVDKLIQDCLGVIKDRKETKPQIEELTSEYQRAIAKEQYDDFDKLQRRFLEMTRQEKR